MKNSWDTPKPVVGFHTGTDCAPDCGDEATAAWKAEGSTCSGAQTWRNAATSSARGGEPGIFDADTTPNATPMRAKRSVMEA